jgi:1-aminocyclopropane-1-carboxylate deaminase
LINAVIECAKFTELYDETLRRANSRLWLWRLDQIPSVINGNKAFKLLPGLAEAQDRGFSGVASFGGAWSNHLHVLAAAGRLHNLKTLGFVRGDSDAPPSAMLVDAVSLGMSLHFLSRSDYRQRHDPGFLKQLQAKFPDYHWLPEGGSNLAGVRGCSVLGEALSGMLEDGDIVALPCGTGGTMAGLISGLAAADGLDLRVVGYSALKGANFLDVEIRRWLVELDSGATAWSLEHRFHGGGYGKCNGELSAFILDFYRRHRIALDPVYNAKMLWGIYRQLAAGEFDGRRIIALHTGGVQGLRGYPALLADMTQVGFESLQ